MCGARVILPLGKADNLDIDLAFSVIDFQLLILCEQLAKALDFFPAWCKICTVISTCAVRVLILQSPTFLSQFCAIGTPNKL